MKKSLLILEDDEPKSFSESECDKNWKVGSASTRESDRGEDIKKPKRNQKPTVKASSDLLSSGPTSDIKEKPTKSTNVCTCKTSRSSTVIASSKQKESNATKDLNKSVENILNSYTDASSLSKADSQHFDILKDLEDNNELFLLKVPKYLNPELLMKLKIKLDEECTVNIGDNLFNIVPEYNIQKFNILGDCEGKTIFRILDIKRSLTLSQEHEQNVETINLMLEEDSVQFPKQLKDRNLLVDHYEEKVKLKPEINDRLNDLIEGLKIDFFDDDDMPQKKEKSKKDKEKEATENVNLFSFVDANATTETPEQKIKKKWQNTLQFDDLHTLDTSSKKSKKKGFHTAKSIKILDKKSKKKTDDAVDLLEASNSFKSFNIISKKIKKKHDTMEFLQTSDKFKNSKTKNNDVEPIDSLSKKRKKKNDDIVEPRETLHNKRKQKHDEISESIDSSLKKSQKKENNIIEVLESITIMKNSKKKKNISDKTDEVLKNKIARLETVHPIIVIAETKKKKKKRMSIVNSTIINPYNDCAKVDPEEINLSLIKLSKKQDNIIEKENDFIDMLADIEKGFEIMKKRREKIQSECGES